MLLFKRLIFAIVLFFGCTVMAQNNELFKIVEIDNKGNPLPIEKYGPQIVDINGDLEITIDKEKLTTYLQANYPDIGSKVALQQQITQLEKALVKKQQVLSLLQQNVRSAADDQALNTAMLNFLNVAMLPGNAYLYDEYNALYFEWERKYGTDTNPPMGYEAYIISQMSNNLEQAQLDIKKFEGARYNLSLVAFLKNKQGQNKDKDDDRVHIENFDTYTEQGFYEVPRWVTSLSGEQLQQLQDMKDTTDKMNASNFDVFNSIKTKLKQYLADLECVVELKDEVQAFLNLDKVKQNISEALTTDAQNLIKEFDAYKIILNALQGDLNGLTITSVFEVLDQFEKVSALTKNLPDLISKFENTVDTIAEITAEATDIKNMITTCYNTVKAKVEVVANAFGMLKNQQNDYLANDQIGKEVYQFTIDNLPENGYITLTGTGQRENGEKLEIDFLLRIPKSNTSEGQSTTSKVSTNTETVNYVMDRRMLTMQLVGWRSETAVGIIMADPLNAEKLEDALPRDRRFLYAPSASLLFKRGSRSSTFYNSFFDPGVGIVISTPDFNTDGTPEFGVGGVVTFFKDILSIGFSYNVTLDLPYWHFGVNLPFNLPGIPINTAR